MNDRTVLAVGAVGTGKQSWGLPGSPQIASIQIDNPSGSWLKIVEDDSLIPPYTLDYQHIFSPTISQVSVLFAAAPTGQVASVAVGDPITLVIFDSQDTKSHGIVNSLGNTYKPLVNKQIFTTVAFGNLGVTQFTGDNAGRLIAGLVVDNPSGSWLTIVIGGATYFVSPYQLRWVKRIDPPVTSLTSLSFTNGPASQVSTKQGDQVTLTLLDQEPDSKDTSFIQGFTPVITGALSAAMSLSTAMVGQQVPNLVATANKRWRILTVYAALKSQFSTPPSTLDSYDSGLYWLVYASTDANYRAGEGRLNPYKPTDDRTYPMGMDFPIGAGVIADAYPDFTNSAINIVVTAILI